MNVIPSMQEYLLNQCAKTTADVFMQAATRILSRPPIESDAKDFCMVSHVNYPGIEFITYKGVCYGRFKTEWTTSGFSYTFEPVTTFERITSFT